MSTFAYLSSDDAIYSVNCGTTDFFSGIVPLDTINAWLANVQYLLPLTYVASADKNYDARFGLDQIWLDCFDFTGVLYGIDRGKYSWFKAYHRLTIRAAKKAAACRFLMIGR